MSRRGGGCCNLSPKFGCVGLESARRRRPRPASDTRLRKQIALVVVSIATLSLATEASAASIFPPPLPRTSTLAGFVGPNDDRLASKHPGLLLLRTPARKAAPIPRDAWGAKFSAVREVRRPPSSLLSTREPPTETEDSTEKRNGDAAIGTKTEKKKEGGRGKIDATPSSRDAYSDAARAVADWTTASSIGSFLLQRQREEEDQVVVLEEGEKGGAAKKLTVHELTDSEKLEREESKRRRRDGGGEKDTGADVAVRPAAVEIIDETDISGVGKKIIESEVEGAKRFVEKKKDAAKAADELRTKPIDKPVDKGGFQIDEDQARQVDDAVNPLTNSMEAIMKDIKVLPMTDTTVPSRAATSAEPDVPPLATKKTKAKQKGKDLLQKILPGKGTAAQKALPLSDPDHYGGRIDRDMRQLAVSIASSVDFAWQWRLFCDEGGGLFPLIQCIRDGAKFLQEGASGSFDVNGNGMIGPTEQHEEAFVAACAACRNLRDLCALSPEFSAVATDGILRADAALSMSIPNETPGQECLSGGLLSDLIVLMRHANEAGEVYSIGQPGQERGVREARSRCKLYIMQLLLAMAVASDAAVTTMRATSGLTDVIVASSSYAPKERRRRWIRYPLEIMKKARKRVFRSWRSHGATVMDSENDSNERPFIAAASVGSGMDGEIQRTANMVLAAMGHNVWVPKIPGQKGLRILCLDGGGSRGITAITSLRSIVDAMGGLEVADSFDIIAGTSTGAIIAFLVGLRRETSGQAKKRYDKLIARIFVKSALSTPMLVFTTAAYDERHFNEVMEEILGDTSMLESRADPAVPLVFCISSKMTSNPIQISLFRNYNYGGGELSDPFAIDPETARMELGLKAEDDIMTKLSDWEERGQMSGRCSPRITEGSRHSGSFRILQRAALRATTAAPTFFKPVMMGGELYSDGGIVASNPAAVAIHEARTLFPDVPIEMVVSCGTGGFVEEKTPPKIGWDGIIGQIVNSATDGEQIHHILEDILGEGGTTQLGKSSVSSTRYYRLNPVVGGSDEFPIDVTDPGKLEKLTEITKAYLQEPEQQRKLKEISDVLEGKQGWRRFLGW